MFIKILECLAHVVESIFIFLVFIEAVKSKVPPAFRINSFFLGVVCLCVSVCVFALCIRYVIQKWMARVDKKRLWCQPIKNSNSIDDLFNFSWSFRLPISISKWPKKSFACSHHYIFALSIAISSSLHTNWLCDKKQASLTHSL